MLRGIYYASQHRDTHINAVEAEDVKQPEEKAHPTGDTKAKLWIFPENPDDLLSDLPRDEKGLFYPADNISPWFKVALREAEESRDVSLVYKLDNRNLKNLRGIGIKTLDYLVCAKVDFLPKIPQPLPTEFKRIIKNRMTEILAHWKASGKPVATW